MVTRKLVPHMRRSRGFTIIELLVVVIVIGILAAAGMSKYQNFSDMARKRTCCLNQSGIETAVAVWCTQNVDVPDAAEGFGRFEVQNAGWYHGGWGTSGPFHDSWEISRVARDRKLWICPSALKASGDDAAQLANSPSYGCGSGNRQSQYHLYWGGTGYGSWNGSGGHWYTHNGTNTKKMLVWCGNNGGYACNGPDNTWVTRHSVKW